MIGEHRGGDQGVLFEMRNDITFVFVPSWGP
jgi:hypothetical protein